MKQIPNSNTEGQWSSHLLADLSFIKKNLRYPTRPSTYMPVLVWSVILLLIVILTSLLVYEKIADGEKIPTINLLMTASTTIVFLSIIVRYLQSLKFITLHTGLYLTENRQVLEGFLKSLQLLTFRHPDAPEVFQILSRNISAGKEDREIIIFIADNKRILLNSHFTNSGWGMSPQRHHRQMAKMLKEYLTKQYNSTELIHKL